MFFWFAPITILFCAASNEVIHEQEIDKRIEELKEKKLGYEGKALQFSNQAERFQFMEGELQTAKKYWKLAELNKKIADELQKEIDQLEASKLNK